MEIQLFLLIISLILNIILIYFVLKFKFENLTREKFELKCVEFIFSRQMSMKNSIKIKSFLEYTLNKIEDESKKL
ncbi:MAG: hypothetical protein ACN23H_01845 [Candidatus Phytoplasma vitis]|nr:MAG: hypothetical protein M6G77_01520 [Candidatus Phytoplasma vitis]